MKMAAGFEILYFMSVACMFTNSYEISKTFTYSCGFMPRCKCIKQQQSLLLKVDCSGLDLKEIPRFPDIVEELHLNKNNITDINDDCLLNNSKLKVLDLSENRIFELRKSSFKGLTDLLHLNLKNNNLNLGNQSFIMSPFEYLQSLTFLNLKNNFASPYQPDLSPLLSLKSLSIDFISNSNGVLAPHYARLKHLISVDMSGLTGKCSVKQLDSNSFENIFQIKNLNISGCSIKSILKSTFAKLKRIKTLDISNNTCLKFDVLNNVTFDLQFSDICILKFNKIHKTFDMNTYLKQEHLKYLTNTSLKEMHMDSNRCQLIEEGALRYLPQTMEHISARDNQFTYGPYYLDFFTVSIKTVDISDMFTMHLVDHSPEVCNSFITCINNQSVHDFSKDNRTDTVFRTLPGFGIDWIPYQVKRLYFRSSFVKIKSSKYSFSDNNLEYIDLSNNLITSITGPILNLKVLKYMDLSSNMCTYLSPYLLGPDFLNLEELYLQNNLLGFVFPRDHNGDTFQHLYNLKTLNISNNRIPQVSPNFFKSQKSLILLDLSSNVLEGIDFKIVQMANLSWFNLRNNRITFLDTKARNQLDVMAKNNKGLEVDLGDNPFLCTCETIEFVKWMAFSNVRMRMKTSYRCQLSNLKRIDFKDPDKIYRSLQKNCMTFKPVIGVLVSAITMFLFILCAGLVYRYRWKLRYLYYMVKIRSYKPMSSLDDNDHGDYMYGAFVSYADEDGYFVHKKLLTKLEKENGIQLCLHKRNFLPGNDIATNITSAIHNSRKTIAIISHNFLKSNWCLFEYNMARMESIYERKNENILFLIFIEQVTANELPLHILELVHSQSYIEYPNDEYGDEVFWNQIIRALND